MRRRNIRTAVLGIAGTAVSLGILAGAIAFLWHRLRGLSVTEVFHHVTSIPRQDLFMASLATFFSYLTLTGYDYLALGFVKRRLPYAKVALAAFVTYAFTQSLGRPLVIGVSTRYRYYSRWGLNFSDVAKMVLFCSLTFWIGFLSLTGLFLVVHGIPSAHLWPFAPGSDRLVGLLFLLILLGWALMSRFHKRPIVIRRWAFSLPAPQLFARQLGVASVEWLLAAAALYFLLPEYMKPSFSAFIGMFSVSFMLSFASQVPGGLGVFEALVLGFTQSFDDPRSVAALLVYRVIYFWIPLASAAALFAGREMLGFAQTAKPRSH